MHVFGFDGLDIFYIERWGKDIGGPGDLLCTYHVYPQQTYGL